MSLKTVTLAALASTALANTIKFVTLDNVPRTIKFTPEPGCSDMPNIDISPGNDTTVPFEQSWKGNYYAFPQGSVDPLNAMLGEIAFNAFNDLTYFDISAIVNQMDTTNIGRLFPATTAAPFSGCDAGPTCGATCYPCNSTYYHPDDNDQSVSTPDHDLVQYLGSGIPDHISAVKRNLEAAAAAEPDVAKRTPAPVEPEERAVAPGSLPLSRHFHRGLRHAHH